MKIITTLLMSLMVFSFANAQNSNINYLNKNYEYGTLPNNIGSTDMQTAYTTWKATYVESTCSNGSARIRFDDPAYTVSEGIAYGMLLSAYANDQELFDGLWSYYQINSNSNGVMNWKILGCTTVEGFGGATDAEIDVAIALIIAGNRFGNNSGVNYHNDAETLIAAIKEHEVESGTFVLKPGDSWGGSQNTNPSYLAPGYFKVYGEFTNDQTFWNNVANKSYQILNANLSVNNAVDCLVSDWCKADGSYSDIVPWAYESGRTYYYDAARTPWRIATDYVWYGSAESASYTGKCRNFVSSKGGINQIKAGYTQSGNVIGDYQDPTFTGAFASAILSSTSQSEVNTAYTTLKNQTSTAYFASTLRVLYMYTMSGNLYNPLADDDTDSLSVSSISEFASTGASQTIAVTSNLNWTVSENSSWLSVNTTSGNNNGSVVITASGNTSTSSRSAIITISGGDITRSISISQAGAGGTIIPFIPDPNKVYYIDNPHHNLRLGADGSNDPILTGTSVTTDNVKWKITASPTDDYYYIDNVDGESRPRLRGDNTAFADMNATSSSGTWARWKFTPSSISGTYLMTTLGNTLPRLQINNSNQAAMVTTSSVGTWESFTINEASNSTSIFIEAEDYIAMNGIQTETTTDVNGGENVGYIDAGDWMDYSVTIPSAGNYNVDYRLASSPGNAVFQFQVNGSVLASTNISATGGWQSWTTLSTSVYLNAGTQTVRLYSVGDNFNINWFTIESQSTSAKAIATKVNTDISIYPVPVTSALNVDITDFQEISKLEVVDINGLRYIEKTGLNNSKTTLNVEGLLKGFYLLRIFKQGELFETIKFIK